MVRIIRFRDQQAARLAVVTDDDRIYPTGHTGLCEFMAQARQEGKSPLAYANQFAVEGNVLGKALEELELLVPVDTQEVWAAGVTYERSREARNYEATAGKLDATTFYDKVYIADRPEIFFKSTGNRLVGPNEDVCIRSDSQWQVPEPELGLVIGQDGNVWGYTIGNDMSCRDIEGENPLYLPQAKIWRRSCSIGPAVRLAETVSDPYGLQITSRIIRNGQVVTEGSASTKQLKRKFDELVSFLCRDNDIFDGTVLLTGTCIVPPNEFTLEDGDRIEIDITGIGRLSNTVRSASAYPVNSIQKEAI